MAEAYEIVSLTPEHRAGIVRAIQSDDLFTEDEVAVALELVDDALERPGSDYWVRVATDGAQVLGYICFGPTPMTESTYDLYWIVTAAEARGRGIAPGLIARMESEIRERGGGAVRVETSQREAYGAARRLYDKCNYPEHARFPDFYRAGDDLVVFYKTV